MPTRKFPSLQNAKGGKIFGAIELRNERFEYRPDTVFSAEIYLLTFEQRTHRNIVKEQF